MSSLNYSSSMGNESSDCTEIQQQELISEIQQEETVSDSFICCVCLDLLYKPIVLECGHVSCFWCVHKSMDALHESHCPICRHPYRHFPTICGMLHFLLLRMYPLAYKRREKQIFEEEKTNDCFSPQLDCKELNDNDGFRSNMPTSSCIMSVEKDSSKGNNSSRAIDSDRSFITISSSDVLCRACNQVLFRPVVLNCGHVYCEACMEVPQDGMIICKVCECPHPSDCPNVCLEFNNFLEERFPKEYAAQRKRVEQNQAHSQHRNSSSGVLGSGKKGLFTPSRGSEDFIPWWKENGSKVHAGAGCDYCGMYPIVGDRYRCQDCVELMGFDLCGDCYNTQSKRPGRFNQQHTSDHRFELVKQTDVFQNIMWRLVGGHIVDGSGAPIMAISAIEDPPDGWIGVGSVDAPQDTHNNVAGPNGTPGGIVLDNSGTQDLSIELEFDDVLEASVNSVSSLAPDDHDIDQGGNEDPPF